MFFHIPKYVIMDILDNIKLKKIFENKYVRQSKLIDYLITLS